MNDMYCVNEFKVSSFCEWSDHAKLSFNIICNTSISISEDVIIYNTHNKWNPELKDSFRGGSYENYLNLTTLSIVLIVTFQHR